MASDGPDSPAAARGRCYCGACSIRASGTPNAVAYCHCSDCRRWTGAPVAAFAAFPTGSVDIDPQPGPGFSTVAGVTRWNCRHCGSPIAATFDYLPGQVYVPLGLLDNAQAYPPRMHCHAGSALNWLHLTDDLPRNEGSGREALAAEAVT